MGLYLLLLVLIHYKLGHANCLASLVNPNRKLEKNKMKMDARSNAIIDTIKELFTSVKEIAKLEMEMIAMIISSWMLQGELQCDHHKSSLIF